VPFVLVDERREDSSVFADAFVQTFTAGRKPPPEKSAPQPALWRFGKESRMEEVAKRIQGSKSDVLIFLGSAGDLRDFLTALNQPALPVLWAGDDAPESSLGGVKQRLFHLTSFTLDATTPLAKSFVEQYRKAFKDEPDAYAALAYDDLRMLAEALRQAENHLSPAQIKEKLAALKDFPGLTGPLTVGPDRHVRRPAFVVRLEEGHWRLVKREEPGP
jgi:ABC-type branched-subunit amino acid transport system substrate-binding protein